MKKLLFLIISLIIFSFILITGARAGSGDNVSGWAWIGADCTDSTEATCGITTMPVGWISFNDTNSEITCEVVSYGVNVDYSTGEISGAAWIGVGENNVYTDCNTSENTVGWLYFDSTGTPSCGTGGYPSDYCFPAKIVGNEIQGWAPIISKDSSGAQTIVTWVRFKGSQYSVKINSDGTVGSGAGATDHYAWSNFGREGGLGWIDFSRVRFSAINQPPSATNLQVTQRDYCIVSWANAVFCWQFTDPDGDSQSAYQIQVDNNSNFSSPEVDTGKILSSSNCYVTLPGNLSWNTTYYWQVKVWDSKDLSSAWTSGPSFTTAKHAYPTVDFSWTPQNPAVNKEVQFTASSTVSGGATTSAWFWTFQDGSPANSSVQNATTSFTSTGDKLVTLKVTDSDGFSCPAEKTVNPQLPLPEWREVPPMIWLKNIFAGIINFFTP